MKIIPATEEDIPQLNELIHSCYRSEESLKGWTSEANILSGKRMTPEELVREMNAPEAMILKCLDENENLLACCLTQKQGDRMYTGMLSVRPNLQGAGLGKKMMTVVEELGRERNCVKVKLQVITVRTELIVWYERLGFKRNGKSVPFSPKTEGVMGVPKDNLQLVLMEMEKPL